LKDIENWLVKHPRKKRKRKRTKSAEEQVEKGLLKSQRRPVRRTSCNAVLSKTEEKRGSRERRELGGASRRKGNFKGITCRGEVGVFEGKVV